MDFKEYHLPPNPVENANILSRTFFVWVMPLFKKGYSKDLEVEDLYDILKQDRTGHLGDKLERYWEEELKRSKLTGKKPSLRNALIKMMWKTFLCVVFIYALNFCVLTISQPIFLRLLIITFNEKEPESWKAYTYAGALTLSAFLATIVIHPGLFQIMTLGMKARVAVSTLVYRKSLKLSKAAQQKTNSGQIVNLLSNDCTRFDLGIIWPPFLPVVPFQVGALIYLLYWQIGLACLAGVTFLIALIPLQYYLGKYSAVFRLKIAERTDERGRIMNEIVGGMRIIKQYAWEKPFSVLIDKTRKLEIVELKKRGILRGSHIASVNFGPKLVQYITFLVFILAGSEPMTSDKVFFTLAALHIFITSIVQFTPFGALGIGEIAASIKRIEEFLLLEEQLTNKALDANKNSDEIPKIFSSEDDLNKPVVVLPRIAMKTDLKQLPYSDLTIVGERGVALSGGQKARVNLARALYREADIYLLDDPLSAVDTKVSRHLFEKCIKEHLRGSTRILVTHQLQYMRQADHILVLTNGKILAQGTYDELTKSGIDFVGLLAAGEAEADANAKRMSNVSQISHRSSIAAVDERSLKKSLSKQEKENGKPEENKETKSGGSVTGRTYWDYFMSGHSVFGFIGLSASFVICQIFTSGNDWWLSFWTNAEAKRIENGNDDDYLGENIYLYIYTGFAVAVTATCFLRGIWFFMYCASSGVSIHDRMFRSMVRTGIRFFDDNPSGRIMNRFMKDMGTLDELLPPAFIDAITIFLQCFGVLAVVIISNYYLSVPTVVLFVILYYLRKIFVETARDIKRIESITRSPLFTHVAATLQGLTTIRACNSQQILINQFEGHQDIHTSTWFLFLGANRCFAIWLELVSDLFLAIVTFSFILISSSTQGGNVGLAISSLLSLMGEFQWGMRQSAETENYMTSVERALEYSKLEPEADLDSKAELKPPPNWPERGQVEFRNMSLSYDEGKPVLKNLSFKILPSEKIGIVGRTGAGKSSIIAALFRMTEPEGDIIIDDVNVNGIGLHDLRKKISIIPQDPVLFSGSVRYNLDPFNQFDDLSLWKAIEEVELKEAVPSLDHLVADGGVNFSVGQRQLVCLARAILRKNKILVLDEATANVDYKTDNLIQQTIRSKFSECTIITIAHRLNSIIDCDRILVLDHGVLKEYDHPYILLKNEDGSFTGMVNQTGRSTGTMLKNLAKKAYFKKNPSAMYY